MTADKGVIVEYCTDKAEAERRVLVYSAMLRNLDLAEELGAWVAREPGSAGFCVRVSRHDGEPIAMVVVDDAIPLRYSKTTENGETA